MSKEIEASVEDELTPKEVKMVNNLRKAAGMLQEAGFTPRQIASAFCSIGAEIAREQNGRAMAVEWLRYVADEIERPLLVEQRPN
ncbi:hypothetical protein [Defluviimonas salinarum]|uniref:Uncharacterized protein n=1 Tax=Defluviimonas salinarum TaxID=2992147 RepID=A0ABT3IXW9_9RHOB|nr:hypothetical protein [Defluviimonas salinarum]MCW3780271.1 hypothetical protein [Defluviimonas salinarum]